MLNISVKRHWKTFVRTLKSSNLIFNWIAIISLWYSIREPVVLGITFFIVLYAKKHMNFFFVLIITLVFLFVYISHTIPEQYIQKEIQIIQTIKDDYYQINTVRSNNKKYIFYSRLDQYQVGDIVFIKAEVEAYSSKWFASSESNTYLLGQGILGELDIEEIQWIKNDWTFYSLRDYMLTRVQTLKMSPYILAFFFNDNQIENDALDTLNINYLFRVSGVHLYVIFVTLKTFIFHSKRKFLFSQGIILSVLWYLQAGHPSIERYIFLFLISAIIKSINIKYHQTLLLLGVMGLHLLINPLLLYNDGFFIGYSIIYIIHMLRHHIVHTNKILQAITISISIHLYLSLWSHSFHFMSALVMPVFIFIQTYVIFLLTLLVVMFPIVDPLAYDFVSHLIMLYERFSDISISAAIPKLGLLGISVWLIIITLMYQNITLRKKVVLGYSFLLLIGSSFFSYQVHPWVDIYFLDVGQGNATIIKSHACVIVIDAYKHVTSTLQSFGISTIDYLILTHDDLDHTKEKDTVLKKFYTRHALTSPYQQIEKFTSMKIYHSYTCDDIKMTAISPGKQYYEDNPNSLVILLTINNYNILIMGDATTEVESDIIKTEVLPLKIDILLVGHHGSDTSTSREFIEETMPTYGVISVGENNYGMPKKSVIQTLSQAGVIPLNTINEGNIHFRISQRTLTLIT